LNFERATAGSQTRGAEDAPRDRRARTGGEEKVVASPAGSHLVLADVLAELIADADSAVLVVLGVVADRPDLVGSGDLLRHLEYDAPDVDLASLQVDIDRAESREFSPADAGLDRD
jgi:hypothetical protein